MVKGLVQPVPLLLLFSVPIYKYKLLLVQVLLVYSSPEFFVIDRHYFSFELQQTGHHKTLHLRSPKLHTENSFSANTGKYWRVAGLQNSPFKHLEALNQISTIVSLLFEKHRIVQKNRVKVTLFDRVTCYLVSFRLLIPSSLRGTTQFN